MTPSQTFSTNDSNSSYTYSHQYASEMLGYLKIGACRAGFGKWSMVDKKTIDHITSHQLYSKPGRSWEQPQSQAIIQSRLQRISIQDPLENIKLGAEILRKGSHSIYRLRGGADTTQETLSLTLHRNTLDFWQSPTRLKNDRISTSSFHYAFEMLCWETLNITGLCNRFDHKPIYRHNTHSIRGTVVAKMRWYGRWRMRQCVGPSKSDEVRTWRGSKTSILF